MGIEYRKIGDPTEQQIITTLATRVMGWTLSRNELYWHIDGEIQATSGWNPLQNIADAWMLVEKFKNETDPITRAKFAVSLPAVIYSIEPSHICYAALQIIEEANDRT
ncbi:BC1872 family protein [Brevibacillus borstelensis]|uniref:BC1872 family protein n=1 Tax=Brevibacillus borstelensis TaxID=45462 RepID=UPI0030FB264E